MVEVVEEMPVINQEVMIRKHNMEEVEKVEWVVISIILRV